MKNETIKVIWPLGIFAFALGVAAVGIARIIWLSWKSYRKIAKFCWQ